MGQAISFAEGVLAGNIFGYVDGTYEFLNTTKSTSALANELRRRPVNQNTRLIGVQEIPYLAESPISEKISVEGTEYLPGKTYAIWARPGNGKSTALQNFVAHEISNARDGLYVRAEGSLNIVEALQKELNTTCDSMDIVKALVSALGSRQGVKGVRKRSSFLVIDEVNSVNLATGSFIQYLFQKIAEDLSVTCIIASNKEETANYLVNLNGGKIIPHPRFMTGEYQPGQDIAWDDVRWTVPQLEALLRLKHPTARIGYDFLQEGMTPGDAISRFIYRLDQATLA